MQKVEKKVVYKAFGLSVVSDIPLPELLVLHEDTDITDIDIVKTQLTNTWETLEGKKSGFFIEKNLVMFKFYEVAIFSIRDGKQIAVSPLKKYEEDIVRMVLLGTCMGAILMQRRILPLHGSAIAINGKAYAIVGESGAGKSTLASAFMKNGYQLLTDDVIAVSLSKDNIPYVIPSYPQQKLWQETLEKYDLDLGKLKPVFGRETKYCIPVASNYRHEPLPLAGVFELSKTESGECTINSVLKMERFLTLFHHTYRNFLIHRLGLMSWHFDLTAKVLNSVSIYQLRRPNNGFCVPELVTTILNTIQKGE